MIKIPENHQFWEHMWPMIDGAIIGAFGGIVNGLRQKTFKEWSQIVVSVITAGFAGMLAQLLSGWLGADIRLQFALSGIAGYSGGLLLDDVLKHVRAAINKGGDALVGGLTKTSASADTFMDSRPQADGNNKDEDDKPS